MQSPWGDIRVADAHVHFFSRAFFNSLAALAHSSYEDVRSKLESPDSGWQLPPEDTSALADRWLAELDRHGVSRATLMASTPGDKESVAAAVSRHPERFHGYFMLSPVAQESDRRLDQALRSGLRGVCLFPAMHRYSIQDSTFQWIFEVAASHRAVVFVHCGILSVGVRKKLGIPSHFDMRFSNPIDLYAVALQFPQVKFVIPHFGAGYFREALMLCDLCPNVYFDTSSSNSWMRYEALGLEDVFRRALTVCGPQRILFGTDSSYFPRGWNVNVWNAQVQALANLGVSREDAEGVFGGNLERLLAS